MRKKKTALVIALLLVLTMLAACGGGTTTDTPSKDPAPAAETAKAEETKDEATAAEATPAETAQGEAAYTEYVDIEFMNMSQTWKPVIFGEDPVTKVFMEKTGVRMICSAPQGDGDQIANVMLVSGDYPEMMHMGYNPTFTKYEAGGALMAVDELAKQYGYESIIDGTYIPTDVVRIRTAGDGHLYMMPNWFSTDGFGSVGTAVNVRNDIYQQLGEPAFTTLDDFYNYLVQVKDLGLKTSDGLNMWPLAYNHTDKQYLGYMSNWWGGQTSRYFQFNEDTQKVEFYLRDPGLAELIKFLSKCLNDGLLDPEVLTQDGTQRTEALNTGKYAVSVCELWDLWTPNSALRQIDPEVYYKAVPPPQATSDKKQWFGRMHKAGGSGTMITQNCQNPEAAIRFCNFFLSPEGETLNFYGVEGNTMEFKDGKPYLFPEAYEAKLADWDGYARSHGVRVFDFMNSQQFNWEREQESPDRQADRKVATDYAFDATIMSAVVIDPATDEGILFAAIDADVRSGLTKMILEKDPAKIDVMMAELLAEYERQGLSTLEDMMTAFYLSKQ